MTPKQLRVLEFIRDFKESLGYAPTLDEIASYMKVCKVTVRQYLQALERQGAIFRRRYGHRSIEIGLPQYPVHNAAELPLLGYIAAGAPVEAVEVPENLDIGESLSTGRELFALRVRGDSMLEEGILDGDYVILERREVAENGEAVVALLEDGSATLKKFYREKNRIRLQPANEKLEPIYVKSCTIQGVVRGVFRPA
jgi:repressor LexA